MEVSEVIEGIQKTYDFLFELNGLLLSKGYPRFEELVLGNTLSGVISELLVKNISNCSKAVARNEKVGGHPDLIPRNRYPDNKVLRGEGIEIKTSIQPGGWQGHNPESVWLMVFRYLVDDRAIDAMEKKPIEFVQVPGAKMRPSDWSFSGRVGASRRTITASITATGMDKLRSNPLYQNPAFIVAPTRKLFEKYQGLDRPSSSRNQD